MDGQLLLVKRSNRATERDHSLMNLDFQASQAGSIRFRQMPPYSALNFLVRNH